MARTAAKDPPSPLTTRRVGARLRKAREAAGKSMEDAGLALMCHKSKIYRIESGRTLARPGDIRELSAVYGVPDVERDEMMRLVRSATEPGVLDRYRGAVSEELSLLADLEAVATEVRAFEVEWVWAGVQAPAYTAAILRLVDVSDEVRRKRAAFRAARQTAMRESGAAVHVVMSEAALMYEVGGPGVMADQRAHMMRLAAEGVDIRVRPFKAGPHPWMSGGAFTVLDFPEAADPSVVYTQSHMDSRYMEMDREVAEHKTIFGVLQDQAIDVREFLG